MYMTGMVEALTNSIVDPVRDPILDPITGPAPAGCAGYQAGQRRRRLLDQLELAGLGVVSEPAEVRMPDTKSFFCENDPGEYLYSLASDYLSDPLFEPGGIEVSDDSTGAPDAAGNSGGKIRGGPENGIGAERAPPRAWPNAAPGIPGPIAWWKALAQPRAAPEPLPVDPGTGPKLCPGLFKEGHPWRGDDFKRGSSGHGDASAEERTSPDPTPATGRDNIPMFWESIGMKPGDDWKNEASSGGPGRPKRGRQDDGEA